MSENTIEKAKEALGLTQAHSKNEKNICPKCFKPVFEDTSFCPHCGYATILDFDETPKEKRNYVIVLTYDYLIEPEVVCALKEKLKIEHSKAFKLANDSPIIIMKGLSEKAAQTIVDNFNDSIKDEYFRQKGIKIFVADKLMPGQSPNEITRKYIIRGTGIRCPNCGCKYNKLLRISKGLFSNTNYYLCERCNNRFSIK